MNQTDRIFALASVWAAAKETYPYFDRLTVNWDDAFRLYLEKISLEADETQVWLLLASFTRLLNDGHSTVILPRHLTERSGFFPFEFEMVGDRFLVIAASDRCDLGKEVTGIDGIPVQELVRTLDQWQYTSNGRPFRGRLERWLPLMLSGTTHMLETDAGSISFSLAEKKPDLLRLPDPIAGRPSRSVSKGIRLFEPGILYVRLDDLTHVDQADAFSSLLERQKPCAVLFDIRRNVGGMTLCGAKYAQPFFPGSFGGCRKWTQQRNASDAASAAQLTRMSETRIRAMLASGILSQEDFDNAKKYADRMQYERYCDTWEFPCSVRLLDCPVLLLTSRDTISAAEDFAAFFRSNHRGILMGEPTFGSTGSPLPFRLPGDGFAQIVSVGYELADGTPFIGRGIVPDIPFPPLLSDRKSGYDRQLDAAVEYLQQQL
jgi:hypothetical protein